MPVRARKATIGHEGPGDNRRPREATEGHEWSVMRPIDGHERSSLMRPKQQPTTTKGNERPLKVNSVANKQPLKTTRRHERGQLTAAEGHERPVKATIAA